MIINQTNIQLIRIMMYNKQIKIKEIIVKEIYFRRKNKIPIRQIKGKQNKYRMEK